MAQRLDWLWKVLINWNTVKKHRACFPGAVTATVCANWLCEDAIRSVPALRGLPVHPHCQFPRISNLVLYSGAFDDRWLDIWKTEARMGTDSRDALDTELQLFFKSSSPQHLSRNKFNWGYTSWKFIKGGSQTENHAMDMLYCTVCTLCYLVPQTTVTNPRKKGMQELNIWSV